ncbi:type I 3-dehydroquinate dehydratase [Streptomyces natalensis]|nr:type I 3-dehydroquinate dehydratase [Streptomyces natalensis]
MVSANGSAGRRARLVAVVTTPAGLSTARLQTLNDIADDLEVRADLVGDPDPRHLRRHFTGSLTYTLRTRRQGGAFEGEPAERRSRLLGAAAQYDLVDLEWPNDLQGPDCLTCHQLSAIPAPRRRISWQGTADGGADLPARFAAMAAEPAALYLLAPRCADPDSAAAMPLLLSGLGRSDVTAFASGPEGTWTRILAPWLGAPVAFGLAGPPGADGTPGVEQLKSDYGLPELPALRGLYGAARGAPGRSLFPRLQNAAFRELGLPALYLPFPIASLSRFLRRVAPLGERAGLPLRGLTVSAPHREDALDLADTTSPLARSSGAVNVLRLDAGHRYGDDTDSAVALRALARLGIDPAGRTAAVIGCGGAGRSIAVALHRAGAQVTLVNRDPIRGRKAAELLGLPFVPLAAFSAGGHSVLVHATPLVERAPFPVADADPDAVILELAYRGDAPTPLMAAARARGMRTVDGLEVLLLEAQDQLRILTGRQLPVASVRPLLPSGRPLLPPVRPLLPSTCPDPASEEAP